MSTSTEPPTTLAELVRLKRTEKGLSRTKLGALTKTSISSMNRLELANAVPLAPSLFRIAEVLDIDLQTLQVLVLQAAEAKEAEDEGAA